MKLCSKDEGRLTREMLCHQKLVTMKMTSDNVICTDHWSWHAVPWIYCSAWEGVFT